MQRRTSVEASTSEAAGATKKMSKLHSNVDIINCPICFDTISEGKKNFKIIFQLFNEFN